MELFGSHMNSTEGVIRSSTKLLPALRANYEAVLVRIVVEARSQVAALNAQALKTTVDALYMLLPMPVLKLEDRPRKGKMPWIKMVVLGCKKSPKSLVAVGTNYRHAEFNRFGQRKDDGLIRLSTVVI